MQFSNSHAQASTIGDGWPVLIWTVPVQRIAGSGLPNEPWPSIASKTQRIGWTKVTNITHEHPRWLFRFRISIFGKVALRRD